MIRIVVDDREVMAELDRLSKGPDQMPFEAALAQGYMTVANNVHVITARLKGSGFPHSSAEDDSWEGTISFARHPGIFELARGDSPTLNHPEGGHYFFDPGGEEYVDEVKKALLRWVQGED